MKEISNEESSYIVGKYERFDSSSSSKGNQIKWRLSTGIWLKSDDLGYEGLSESVSSKILENSNIESFTKYSVCKIQENHIIGSAYRGCSSLDFLRSVEYLVTLRRLFELNGIDIDKVMSILNTVDRIRYVINTVCKFTGLKEFGRWLGMLMEFDAFILNEDRHLHNIAVIYNFITKEYRLMPVFDNGGGFLSDTRVEYPLDGNLDSMMRRVSSKPFNTKFSTQLKAVYDVVGHNLILMDFDIDYSQYCNVYGEPVVKRVQNILAIQKEKYKSLFAGGVYLKSNRFQSDKFSINETAWIDRMLQIIPSSTRSDYGNSRLEIAVNYNRFHNDGMHTVLPYEECYKYLKNLELD